MIPVKQTKEQLCALMLHMVEHIMVGNSFEGSIEYSALDGDCKPGEFMVGGAFRVGNLEGQGGMILIGVDGADESSHERTGS